jgi:hypothetical protein
MRHAALNHAKTASGYKDPVRRATISALQPYRTLQRKCACGDDAGLLGECAECQSGHRPALQRAGTGRDGRTVVPPIVHDVLRSPGRPLDAATRAFMEPRFGHDFSRVRVHADAKAGESADAVNALAYTVGRDVVFGAGHYQPHKAAGRKLLAHELAHVAQQAGALRTKSEITQPGDQYEREADRAALAIGQGASPPLRREAGLDATHQLMRQEASQEDPRVKEIKDKVGALIKTKFKGDYKAAFNSYADKDNTVSKDGVKELLKDADVDMLLRFFAVPRIMTKLDKNKNEKIEWSEFEPFLKNK